MTIGPIYIIYFVSFFGNFTLNGYVRGLGILSDVQRDSHHNKCTLLDQHRPTCEFEIDSQLERLLPLITEQLDVATGVVAGLTAGQGDVLRGTRPGLCPVQVNSECLTTRGQRNDYTHITITTTTIRATMGGNEKHSKL